MSGTQPIFIVGATATGKSAVALALAEEIGGEIISVDSMQVYRGLDIGTAKPTEEERARVPHHLIDVAELTESFDAARFCQLAKAVVIEIQGRNRTPIFCGGTGLYLKSYLEGLGSAPPSDEALRAELEARPIAELLAELQKHDPVTFTKIDQQNPRRVVRAVEVIRLTGKSFSAQRAEWKPAEDTSADRIIGLSRDSSDLHQRINVRVDQMFAQGLVDETRRLLAQGLEKNRTAMQAIGYRQVVEHLRGEHTLPQAIELVKIRTRQFAKRQMTWFRRQLPVRWIELKANTDPRTVVSEICAIDP